MKRPIPFGKYFLLERVNVGGMAEVFKAKTYGVEGFERLLAVKRILPNIAEDEEFITMFIDEAKIAVQLNHANIAQIFDLGKVDDSYFIALEYVHGKDLRAIFDRLGGISETMPIPQACFIIMKVCEGLDYAHNKRDSGGNKMHLVHRDVSPQNVLISYEGEVKLVDFGIAKAVGKASKTEAGILKGKFGYMSPEQVRGLPLDRRSDIFSMGIVLYELLTGERLFLGESDFSTLEKVRNVEILPPSAYNRRIGDELEQIVLKALAKDVDDRYQNAIDLHDDLQAYMYTSGQFYSRKDLANWMKMTWAREIEEEGRKLEEYRRLQPPPPPPPAAGKKKTHPPSLPPPPPLSGLDSLDGDGPLGPSGAPLATPFSSALPSASPAGNSEGMMLSSPTGDPGSLPAMAWDDDEVETQIYDKPPSAIAATLDMTPAPDVSPSAGPPLSGAEPNPPGIAAPVRPGTGWGTPVAASPVAASPVAASPVAASPRVAPVSVPLQPSTEKKRASQLALWMILALLVVLVCAGVLYYFMVYSVRPGSITIAAVPRDVKVFLDGKEQAGSTTPMTIHSLKPGPYIIAVMKDGYGRYTKTVEVKPGIDMRLAPQLQPLATATIELRTVPSGGEAHLDGRKLDGHTPMRISEVTPGKHRLEVRKPPLQAWIHNFDIQPEEVLRLNGTLLPAEVEVRISSNPRGQVNLLEKGKTEKRDMGRSPVTVRLNPKSHYTVVIDQDGYNQWSQPVRFEGGAPVKITAVLSRHQSQVTPPPTPKPAYQPKPKPKPKPRTAYRPKPRTKPVPRPKPKPRPALPAPRPEPPQPVGMGTLLINSTPWTRIIIDNRETGLTTPQRQIPLTAGRHKITLRNPKFNINMSFYVVIKAGERTKVIKKDLTGTSR